MKDIKSMDFMERYRDINNMIWACAEMLRISNIL